MTHKSLQCPNRIYAHGVLKGVNPTYVCMEIKKWSKEVEDIYMDWERTNGLTYRFRVNQENSYN